jgi:hypothetical protein
VGGFSTSTVRGVRGPGSLIEKALNGTQRKKNKSPANGMGEILFIFLWTLLKSFVEVNLYLEEVKGISHFFPKE